MKPNASFIKFKHFPFLFPFLSFFLGEQTDAKTGNDWKSVFLPLTGITTPITPHRVKPASMRRVRNTDHMKSIHNPKLLSILQHIEQQDQHQMPTTSVTWFPLLYWKLFPIKKKRNKKAVRKILLFSGKLTGGSEGEKLPYLTVCGAKTKLTVSWSRKTKPEESEDWNQRVFCRDEETRKANSVDRPMGLHSWNTNDDAVSGPDGPGSFSPGPDLFDWAWPAQWLEFTKLSLSINTLN